MPILRATDDGGRTWYPVAVGSAGAAGADGAKGDKGDKGDPGVGVAIKGSVPTSAQLPTGAAAGDGYLIESSGHLWVYSGSAWVDVGLIRGPQGPPGEITLSTGDDRYVRRVGGSWLNGQSLGALQVLATGGKQGLLVTVPSLEEPVALRATDVNGAVSDVALVYSATDTAWVVKGPLKATSVTAETITASKKVSSAPTLSGDPATTLVTKGYADAMVPPGTIVAYGGVNAPDGWALCNGDTHGSAELEKVLGTKTTPNLVDRFIVAAGGGYARGDKGGASSVTLGKTQLPRHDHGSTGAHRHSLGTNGEGLAGLSNMSPDEITGYQWKQWDEVPKGGQRTIYGVDLWAAGLKYRHQHWTTISGPTTEAGAHTHAVEFGRSDGGQDTVENRPPYYALVYIIKK